LIETLQKSRFNDQYHSRGRRVHTFLEKIFGILSLNQGYAKTLTITTGKNVALEKAFGESLRVLRLLRFTESPFFQTRKKKEFRKTTPPPYKATGRRRLTRRRRSRGTTKENS